MAGVRTLDQLKDEACSFVLVISHRTVGVEVGTDRVMRLLEEAHSLGYDEAVEEFRQNEKLIRGY